MSILITGGAGFIGSNILRALNRRDINDVVVVDNVGGTDKYKNLIDCNFDQYLDKEEFRSQLSCGVWDRRITYIFHQGACSDTMELDGNYMMSNNYRYSIDLFEFSKRLSVPFVYASSASVYGGGQVFAEDRNNESPLNVYGFSKYLFDQYVRQNIDDHSSQVVGLRYFNVYGPRESHKKRMASVAFHFFNQFRDRGALNLFEGSGGYTAGEQRRDFVFVDDVVATNLYFFDNPEQSGIFNCGTGRSQTFNEVAVATINAIRKRDNKSPLTLTEMKEEGLILYVPFPDGLRERYQSFTEADLTQLRRSGCDVQMCDVNAGVDAYIDFLLEQSNY